jgi:predicted ATPase/DNA-binding winged helix-turn-helix (wHTH) protein
LDSGEEIRFGNLILLPGRKVLLRGGNPVRIGQRALDLLIALARQPGEVLDRDALVSAVWPGRHVEDSNLRAQVAALRKALGESEAEARHVLTVPGRGYSFVGPLQAAPAAPAPGTGSPGPGSIGTSMLPPRLQPVVGREEAIAVVAEKLGERRFVSIIGAGGIGKTTVALAVARHLTADNTQPPLFIDLGTLTDGALVPGQLRAALEAEGSAAAWGEAHRLIILDSCEPVIGAAAALAEHILHSGPRLHVLATSREPLRAEGEWSYRLPSMQAPPPSAALTMPAALGFPAVELFAERVQAAGSLPMETDEDAALMAQICRQLDGIPLAIELAATRASQLGLCVLAERLDDRFRLLMQGRRTALPRHQTLRATMDWSHDLLPPEEQRLLRRLAAFQGCFSLEAALAVGGGDDDTPEEEAPIVDRIGRLVDKSFLTLQPRPGGMAYRCLDTTRLYLAGKLEEAGETEAVSLRHARYFASLFERAEALWAMVPVAEARSRLAPDIDNLRAAIEWSLGPARQAAMGIALTLSGVPLWSAFGMMDETKRRLDTAIAAFRSEAEQDPRLGMRLFAALGTVTVFLSGTVESAWVNTLIFAEQLDDTEHQLRALNGLALAAMRRDYDEALAFARRFRDVAWKSGEPDDGPVGDRLVGYILHMRGEQEEARHLTEAMLARYPRRTLQAHQSKLNFFDQRILSKSTLVRILWLQGDTAQALSLADETVAEARTLDHPLSHFFTLGLSAGPIAFLSGDQQRLAAARGAILGELRQVRGWVLWGESFQALEIIRAGEPEAGLAMLRDKMAAMPSTAFSARLPILHVGVVNALLQLGRADEALSAVDNALADARACHELWFEPEYLRLRGECIQALGRQGVEAEAAAEFRAAAALAERQTALAWSLRAATSLARLLRDTATIALLAAILARFPAEADTPDLRAARLLISGG